MCHLRREMDTEDVNYSVRDLEIRTYRYLQQLAKSLSLPSNVKKVYLVQLIHAKKFKSEIEVNSIIEYVKSERRQLVQNRKKNRKKHLQNREISSTSKLCQSPQITETPKRSVHPVLRYSPDFTYSVNKCSSRHNYQPSSNMSIRSITSSDRVLRSFNLKTLRKSFGTVNLNNSLTRDVRVQNQATSPKEKFVRIVNADGKLSKISLKCKDRRLVPHNKSGTSCLGGIVAHNHQVGLNQETPAPRPKRQRTLSGIYPLIPQDITYQNFDHIQELKLRRTDGRLSTINALVQKRTVTEMKHPSRQSNDVNIQEILNSIDLNLSNPLHSHLQTYPVGHSSLVNLGNASVSESKENDITDYSVYYHKKIRSKQIRHRRMSCKEPDERLPKITDVFNRFNGVPNRSVMQPLYVQVSEETERVPSSSIYGGRNTANTHMLECIYNFKSSLLTNAPLLQVSTTSNTKCVFSTPVIATAMAQPPALLIAAEPFNMAPCEQGNQYRCTHDIQAPHLYDPLRPVNQDVGFRRAERDSDINIYESPMSQATIPEMVEDALEIISQDGDYMERIGMEIRVQCILCSWAGPKMILESHIRKEHPTEIQLQCQTEWRVMYTLGALGVRRLWLSQVLEHEGALCVISAQYCEPDSVLATLCTLSSDPIDKFGSITLYNKVTGEPHIWEGPLHPLPSYLPYENNLPGLTVQLSKLDLLPNSANLTLLNKELVLKSPTKVVVGQPQLNDIQIIFYVRIF